jgi:hypothetical protein
MKIGGWRRGASLSISKQTDRLVTGQHDGYWPLTVGQRLDQVHRRANALGRVVLPPYVAVSEAVPDAYGWLTVEAGYVRGTPIRSVRALFGAAPSNPAECVAHRCLALVAQLKAHDATMRWADVADAASWPIAIRVDHTRLRDRLERLARASWCRECDDAPWASSTQRCLWCERVGPPPAELAA